MQFDIDFVKTKKIKGVVFDMDGTLTNSMWAWQEVYEWLFDSIGVAMPEDFMMRVNHLPMRKRADVICQEFNLGCSSQDLFEKWKSKIDSYYQNKLVLKDYVVPTVTALYGMGAKMAVATASEKSSCELFLKTNGILQYFDNITGLNEVSRPKSFPDIYLLATKRMGLEPFETLVFEDALVPLQSAKSGGFTVVGVEDESSVADRNKIMEVSDMLVGFNN